MTRRRKGRNRRRKLRQYRRSTLVLLLTIVYAAVFVAPIFIQQFSSVRVARDVLAVQAAQDAASAFVQIFALFFALTLARIFWFVLWPLLCVASAFASYMMHTFNSVISKDSVAVVLESNTREMGDFFNNDLLIALTSGLLLGVLGIVALKREKKDRRDTKVSALLVVIVVGLITINEGSMSTRFPPYNMLTASAQYALERTMIFSTPRRNISETVSQIRMLGSKPLTIVLVIGESARGDHFSINGYERDTTPLLKQRMEDGKNLMNFAQASSCGVWTRISVPCMLTRATEADKSPIYSETSLISLFKSLGFRTVWLGTQHIIDHPLIDIIHESDHFNLLENRQFLDNTVKDEELLPLFDKVLAEQTGPTLVVLHTFGSHWQYSSRYTAEFEKFKPTCGMTLSRSIDAGTQIAEIKDCYSSREALVNSYDNSILYTDHLLNEVIKRLEDKNALFMFSSDHGESLGESERFLHGYEHAPENHKVAMVWWASNDFIANNPARWETLSDKRNEIVSHDNIFHSVLDCAGVTTSLLDPSLSLCRKAPPTGADSAAPEPASTAAPAEASAPTEKTATPEAASPASSAASTAQPKSEKHKEQSPQPDDDTEETNETGTDSRTEPAHDDKESYLRQRLADQARRMRGKYVMDEFLILETMR